MSIETFGDLQEQLAKAKAELADLKAANVRFTYENADLRESAERLPDMEDKEDRSELRWAGQAIGALLAYTEILGGEHGKRMESAVRELEGAVCRLYNVERD